MNGVVLELLGKYLLVFGWSMLKFIFGPVLGAVVGLSLLESLILTILGMMATVFILTYLGANLRKRLLNLFAAKKKLFTPRNRRIVRIWRKYGILGVTFLTPVFLSPPVGTIMAVSFGEQKGRIIYYMFLSAVFWGIFFNLLVFLLGKEVFEHLVNH